jgi:hypothetical protein
MRNIDKSAWLTQPDLEVVEVKEAGSKGTRGLPRESGEFAARSSQFVVYATQVSAADDAEDTDVTPRKGGKQGAAKRTARATRASK